MKNRSRSEAGDDREQHGDHHVAHARRILFPSARSGRSPLAAAACAAGIALGNWQARRAEEKRALGARLDQSCKGPPLEIPDGNRPARLRHEARRGARALCGRAHRLPRQQAAPRPAGYEVVTPLRLDGVCTCSSTAAGSRRGSDPRRAAAGAHARGRSARRRHRPRAAAACSRARRARARESAPEPRSAGFAAETGLRLQPFVIEQHSPARRRPGARLAARPTRASRSTRATRCSGIRSPRSPWSCSSCCRSAVPPRLKLVARVPGVRGAARARPGLPTTSAGAPARRATTASSSLRGRFRALRSRSCAGSGCWSPSTPRPATPTARGSSTSCARCARRRARTQTRRALWVLTDAGTPRPELLAAIEGTPYRAARGREGFPGQCRWTTSIWSTRSAT